MAKGSVGVSAVLRYIAPPELRQIEHTVKVSKAAKLRLDWMDYYRTHGKNAALTCRHFGIARSCFFKWKKRFDLQGVRGLEDHSKRPKVVRRPLTPVPVVQLVTKLRKANPELSKYKLAVILRRDYGYQVSTSTIGRIISRHDLFFAPKLRPKGHPGRRKHMGIRKPYGLKATAPGELIEVDVKHLPYMGHRCYGFCALDVYTKQATVHISHSISSAQAALAWKKTIHKLGLPKTVLSDNGSENFGAFSELIASQQVTHYLARPHTPKDKPHIERFIGTLERECLQFGGFATDLSEQQTIVNNWLKKYHSYRPHQALGYLTPDEYLAKLRAEEPTSIY